MINFILENFDTIFKNKTSLETLDKVILDLAIKGKLVEQNQDDEPASELIKRIKAEKQRLIDEKVIKKEKPLPPIEEEEIPFDIPNSWEWVRLGNIVSILGDGIHGTPEFDDNGEYYFINGNNLINKNILIKENTKKVNYEEYLKYKKILSENTVLFSINGTIGNIAFYNNEKVILGKSACYFNLLKEINKNYIYILLKSEYFLEYAVNNATGTTIKNVSLNVMKNAKVPLPPIEEQKRIVSKVEKLQSIIKDLKEIYIKNQNNRENLKKSLLSEIESQSSDKDLLKNLETVFTNFDKIIKTKEDIKDIRNLILSLAIKGKLVEQNQDDEKASELIKRIKAEKQRLIDEKVIKKEKPLPPIEDEEIPFDIPNSWEWVRLGEIGLLQTGNTPSTSKAEYFGRDIPFITPADISKGKIFYENRGLSFLGKEKGRVAKQNAILQVCIGGSIGKVYYTDREVCFNQQINGIDLYICNFKYIYLILSSTYFYEELIKNSNGTATPIINKSSWGNLSIPLPPLKEQKRIVSKVESLMKICDLLEEKITLNEKISENLFLSFIK